MSIYGLVSGVNKEFKEHYGVAGGANKKISEIYGIAGGINRKVYNGELLRIPSLIIDSNLYSIYPNVSGTVLELDINTTISKGRGAFLTINLNYEKTEVINIMSNYYQDPNEGLVNETILHSIVGNNIGTIIGNASITIKLTLVLKNGFLIVYLNNNLHTSFSSTASYFTPVSYSASASYPAGISYTNLIIK